MRRPLKDQISELELQVQQKRARLEQLRRRQAQEDRKRDTRRKILAGAVVLKAAANDPAFAASLRTLLDRSLSAARDRELFGLAPPVANDPGKPSPETTDRA